ncbi:MAG: hypothetical protein VB050_13210 [Geobacteraceae bacterium]|nr:hypothetical protein [Geobacteraceae bacterium]
MNISLKFIMVKILPDNEIEPFEGQVILVNKINKEAIVVKINTPFEYDSYPFEYILAFPRKETDSFDNMLSGNRVFSSMLRLPAERIKADDPFDINWWRGGGAFLGDIEPI